MTLAAPQLKIMNGLAGQSPGSGPSGPVSAARHTPPGRAFDLLLPVEGSKKHACRKPGSCLT